ncbi:MAG TPA: GNAT family N-acetyltransferase [Candidatus Deferrimicrobium sp.]|nr:GNAT family N-acetyltransferase [Candidatus Deferrimicrobium sp.]
MTTERLLLRQWRESDLDPFAAMMADPEVSRYLTGPGPVDRLGAWRSLAMFIGHRVMRGYTHWAIELRETGEFIGRAGPWRPDGWPAVEIGWAIAPAHQGRGYATEAGRVAQQVAWEALAAERLISLVRPENEASIAVVRKLGGELSERIDFAGGPTLVFDYPKPGEAGDD